MYHLAENSTTVKWIDVSMPHKRNRRLKDHKILTEIAKHINVPYSGCDLLVQPLAYRLIMPGTLSGYILPFLVVIGEFYDMDKESPPSTSFWTSTGIIASHFLWYI